MLSDIFIIHERCLNIQLLPDQSGACPPKFQSPSLSCCTSYDLVFAALHNPRRKNDEAQTHAPGDRMQIISGEFRDD